MRSGAAILMHTSCDLLVRILTARRNRTGHEAEVHMQLLVAVKQGEAGIVGDEIDLGLLVSAYHYDIFNDS